MKTLLAAAVHSASPKIVRASALVAILGLSLVGCAAIKSSEGATSTRGGLSYYMPKRDIQITVTNSGGKITSITATASTAYADRTKHYELKYQPHMLAKNTMDLDVSEAGLLTSSKANQTGDAVAALGGLGTLAGYLRGTGLGVQSVSDGAAVTLDAPTNCKLDGTHTFLLPAEKTVARGICGTIKVQIESLGWTIETLSDPASELRKGVSYAGVFYRSNLPYKVTITSDSLNAETIVHSPSESPTYFLPIAKTLFANNDAKITLNNGAGVPSKYVQDTDGELAAMLRLPATVVTPYFEAIGKVFQFRSMRRTQDASDMTSSINLELAKIKYQKCLEAIEAKDSELIVSLHCANQ